MKRGRWLKLTDTCWGRLVIGLALVALAISGALPALSPAAWAGPISLCTTPLVTPCLVGTSLILNSADLTFSTFGGGHNPSLTFLADGFTFDTTVPLSGPGSASATYTISTLNGLATIEDLSASLINDLLTDSVFFSTPGGDLVLDSATPSGEKLFSPVSSFSGSITVVLGGGETLEGLTVHFSQIPEPSALLLLGSGLGVLGATAAWRRRSRN